MKGFQFAVLKDRSVRISMLRHQSSWSDIRPSYLEIPVRVPVSLVYGDRNWGPKHLMAADAEAIPSVDQPIMMPNTGHFSFRDNPEAVVQIVHDRGP